MKGLHVFYKISDFAVVETLNTLMKSSDRVIKSSKKCTKNVKCSLITQITTITKRKASDH